MLLAFVFVLCAVSADVLASGTVLQGELWTIYLLGTCGWRWIGFGVKAGLVPVNTWLPRAHPAAMQTNASH